MRYLIVAAGCTALTVGAQETELENLVVSAARTPIALEQSGSSITVIDRAELENRQATFLLDVLRDVPGVAVSRSGSFGSTTQIRLRGSEANHVLVLVDGVEMNDPSLGDAVDFAHISARNLERIEVIRGPQSALWGSDAVGGVISIVTREATKPLSLSGYVEAGSFSTKTAGAHISGRGESFAYSGNVALFDTDGTNISRSGPEDDGYDNQTFSFKTSFDLTDRWTAGATLRRTSATTQFDPTDFGTGFPTDGDNETEVNRSYGSVFSTFSAGSWRHEFNLDLLSTDNKNFANGNIGTRQAADKVSLSYQAALQWRDQGVVFALEHEEDDFEQRGDSPFGDPNQDQVISNRGYIVEYHNNSYDPLNFSISARHDSNSDFDDVTSYRISGSYQINDATRLRAAVGTGQKRPTFTELFGFFPDQFLGNPNLQPEESTAWEVGVNQYFGTVRTEITYFNERLKNEINGFVFDLNTFQFTAENQDGNSRRQGIEFGLSGDLGQRVSYSASYTYTDADEPNGDGRRVELRRPKHRGSANLNFSVTPRANINLNLTYNGTQQDQFFPPFPNPSEIVDLDNYTLVNLAGHWEMTPRLTLTGRVENLLDEDYEEVFGFRAPGTGAFVGLQFKN